MSSLQSPSSTTEATGGVVGEGVPLAVGRGVDVAEGIAGAPPVSTNAVKTPAAARTTATTTAITIRRVRPERTGGAATSSLLTTRLSTMGGPAPVHLWTGAPTVSASENRAGACQDAG